MVAIEYLPHVSDLLVLTVVHPQVGQRDCMLVKQTGLKNILSSMFGLILLMLAMVAFFCLFFLCFALNFLLDLILILVSLLLYRAYGRYFRVVVQTHKAFTRVWCFQVDFR